MHSLEDLFCRPYHGGLRCLCCFCCVRFPGIFIATPKQGPYAMLSLLYGLQRKFIRGAKLSSEDVGENIRINVNTEKIVKPICMVDVGTKAKTMLAQNMISDEGQEKFRKGCLKFFQVSVSYLQQKLPVDVNLLRNAQFLNPVKRKAGGATSAISNLALKYTGVLENVLVSIFQMESKHTVVDAIRNPWHFF